MKFNSKKDMLFTGLIYGLNTFLGGIIVFELLSDKIDFDGYVSILVIFMVIGFTSWVFHGTYYELNNRKLKYQSGPIKGEIDIDQITEIIKGKTLWVGLKPATSRNGLIIKYEKYNEIYISPNTNDSFIEKILEIKTDIKITE